MQLSEQCCRIAPKQEGKIAEVRILPIASPMRSSVGCSGGSGLLIESLCALRRIAKLPDLLQAAHKRRRRAYSSERATADLLLRLLVTASGRN